MISDSTIGRKFSDFIRSANPSPPVIVNILFSQVFGSHFLRLPIKVLLLLFMPTSEKAAKPKNQYKICSPVSPVSNFRFHACSGKR
jgi:hypothetical protein